MPVPAVAVLVCVVAALLLVRPPFAWPRGLLRGTRRQPEAIHLQPACAASARRPERIEADAHVLVAAGFRDAGWFTVAELPDLVVRLLAHETEGWLAALFEHRRAGHWVEIRAGFPDGSRICVDNVRGIGLAGLPDLDARHLPGVPAADVAAAARVLRRNLGLAPLAIRVGSAARAFEDGYAWIVAARRARLPHGDAPPATPHGPPRRDDRAA